MVSQFNSTLYSVIKDHEGHFQEVVYKAVESSLIALGDQVRNLDWANVSVSTAVVAKAA